jgi:hypothetical protein
VVVGQGCLLRSCQVQHEAVIGDRCAPKWFHEWVHNCSQKPGAACNNALCGAANPLANEGDFAGLRCELAVDIHGYMPGALALAYGQMTHLQNETCLGNRSILLEGSVVEGQSVLAPGSLLPPGRLIPRGQLWAGCPAQYVRDLSADEVRVPAAGGRRTAVTLQQRKRQAAAAARTAPMATALTFSPISSADAGSCLTNRRCHNSWLRCQSSSTTPAQVQATCAVEQQEL